MTEIGQSQILKEDLLEEFRLKSVEILKNQSSPMNLAQFG